MKNMIVNIVRGRILSYLAVALVVQAAAFAARAEIDVVPYPASVVEKSGAFKCPASKKLQKLVKFSKDATIPKEGYRLSEAADGIKVAASDKAGAFYALQTLDQLAKSEKGKTSVPCVEIEDAPRRNPARGASQGRRKCRASSLRSSRWIVAVR